MIFQQLLKKSKGAEAKKDSKTVVSESSNSSNSGSANERSKAKMPSMKRTPKKIEVEVKSVSENIRTAERLVEVYNNFDREELFKLFTSRKAKISFEDDYIPDITPVQVADNMESFRRSFPDVKFSYDSIKEDEPGVVVMEGVKCIGTHTGEPYTMVPGVFPAIPATGIHCMNDEEIMDFTFKDGKIRKMKIIALGSSSGFSGFYQQIGGSLVPPVKEEKEETSDE